MKKKLVLATEIASRNGSGEKFFGRNGEVNASSKSDLIQAIAHFIELSSTGKVVTEEQASRNEENASVHRQMIQAAFDSPEELAALGETMSQEIQITSNRDGFARRFLMYQELSQGSIAQFRVNTKMVTASLAVGPVQTQAQIVRDNILYPNEFYITARPFIEQRDLARTNTDMLQDKYTEALEATMVQEDRTWKAAADQLVGLDNPNLNIVGAFTPQHFAYMVAEVNNWGITPMHTLIASDLWADIAADTSWQGVIDPVSQQELLLTGRLGTIYGTNLISDHFRHPAHKVLNRGEVYVIGDPSQHGGYTDRGGVDSQPIDQTHERIPGRGWAMNELFSLVIANSRSLIRGRKRTA